MMSARAGRPSSDRVLLTVVDAPAARVAANGVGVSVSTAATGMAATSHRMLAASTAAKRMGCCLTCTDQTPLWGRQPIPAGRGPHRPSGARLLLALLAPDGRSRGGERWDRELARRQSRLPPVALSPGGDAGGRASRSPFVSTTVATARLSVGGQRLRTVLRFNEGDARVPGAAWPRGRAVVRFRTLGETTSVSGPSSAFGVRFRTTARGRG